MKSPGTSRPSAEVLDDQGFGHSAYMHDVHGTWLAVHLLYVHKMFFFYFLGVHVSYNIDWFGQAQLAAIMPFTGGSVSVNGP